MNFYFEIFFANIIYHDIETGEFVGDVSQSRFCNKDRLILGNLFSERAFCYTSFHVPIIRISDNVIFYDSKILPSLFGSLTDVLKLSQIIPFEVKIMKSKKYFLVLCKLFILTSEYFWISFDQIYKSILGAATTLVSLGLLQQY